jgi:hypothetical protein
MQKWFQQAMQQPLPLQGQMTGQFTVMCQTPTLIQMITQMKRKQQQQRQQQLGQRQARQQT